MSPEASIEYLGTFRSGQDVFSHGYFKFPSAKKEFEKVDFSMSA